MVINRNTVLLTALLALAACDNTPNKDFEKQMNDRAVARAGDRYATLEGTMPKQLSLTYRQPEYYRDYAQGVSNSYRSTYDLLLQTLDADQEMNHADGLFKSCRAAFSGASAYQKNGSTDTAAVAAARDKVLAALKACRASAKQKDDLALLARFASTGIVLVGLKAVAQGDQERGLAIWREGEKLVAEDKPGFQLGVKTLGGN